MAIIVKGLKVAGVGKPGLSAYDLAKKGGYTGTEAEFSRELNAATSFDDHLENHNLDLNAHPDIQALIDEKIAAIPTPDVSGQINAHNTDADAHEAIRNTIPTNLVNGSATGSLRSVGAAAESGNYKMGTYAFAEGYNTKASGNYSHAEGAGTTASRYYSHAEGEDTAARGRASHAEGKSTAATGQCSHAEGDRTTASGDNQHVQGILNISSTELAHIVGNGGLDPETMLEQYSNAHTLDWDGNAWFAGDVYVGSTSGTNKDNGSKKLATEEFVGIEVAALVGSAPETLDTIEELATALNNNKDIVTVLNDSIATKANKAEVYTKDDVYTKAEVDTLILITPEDIDTICSATTNINIVTMDEGVF